MRRGFAAGELAFAAGLVGLGAVFVVETWAIAVSPGYARIGPRVFPAIVAAGLVAIGLWLAWEAAGRRRTAMAEAVAGSAGGSNWRAFAAVSLGLLLYTVLVKPAGFIVAAATLFVVVARAFGSRRPFRDGLIGLALALAVFVGFTRGLDLALPLGFLGGLL